MRLDLVVLVYRKVFYFIKINNYKNNYPIRDTRDQLRRKMINHTPFKTYKCSI